MQFPKKKIIQQEEEGNPKAIEEEDEKDAGGTDNRDMVDDNKAQKLTFTEIDEMKKQGIEILIFI